MTLDDVLCRCWIAVNPVCCHHKIIGKYIAGTCILRIIGSMFWLNQLCNTLWTTRRHGHPVMGLGLVDDAIAPQLSSPLKRTTVVHGRSI